MKLQIKKLFGKYDYDLDFNNSHKISILIGENGCGKSTILRILKYISHRDFYSLSKIRFESITVSNDNNIETIYYEDIKQNDIVNQYDFRRRLYNFVKNYDFNTDSITIESFNVFFDKMINELSKSIIPVKKTCDDAMIFLKEDLISCGITNESDIKTICYYFNEDLKFQYGSKYYFRCIYAFACGNIIKEKNDSLFGDPIFSMTTDILNSEFFNKDIKDIISPINEIYDFTYLTQRFIPKHYNVSRICEELLQLMKENKKKNESIYNFFYHYFDYERGRKIFFVIKSIVDEKRHLFMNPNYKRECDYLEVLCKYLSAYYDEEIKPDSSEGYFEYGDYDVSVIFDYIFDNFDRIKQEFLNSEGLVSFKSILSKYIVSKNIDFDDDLNLIITDKKTKKELSFDELSSGEKKLLNLFDIVVFTNTGFWKDENKMILLDEPELSMSIYWQEMLLEDLEKSSFGKIIICTQSPNIINEETLKYLIEVKK